MTLIPKSNLVLMKADSCHNFSAEVWRQGMHGEVHTALRAPVQWSPQFCGAQWEMRSRESLLNPPTFVNTCSSTFLSNRHTEIITKLFICHDAQPLKKFFILNWRNKLEKRTMFACCFERPLWRPMNCACLLHQPPNTLWAYYLICLLDPYKPHLFYKLGHLICYELKHTIFFTD